MILNKKLSDKQFTVLEALVIVLLAAVPLFVSFPYRVNIFLSWEGAYRLYLGHSPYEDFGLPMGYGYWIIPSIFFHLFGPYFSSLIKAQFFLNIVSGLTFRGILKSFDVYPGKRFISVVLFCISYSFFNFWPWYNHSVFVFQFIGLYFVVNTLLQEVSPIRKYLQLIGAGFFIFLSFFTKQDGGALGLLIVLAILGYHAIAHKKFKELGVFIASFALVACLFILPKVSYGFGYWFNYGQPPHNSRFSLSDIFDAFFGASQWIKFYLFASVIVLLSKVQTFREFWERKRIFTFALLALGILAEATIIQVTSYTPPDNNIFYHAFAFAFLFTLLNFRFSFNYLWMATLGVSCVMLWWSGVYWKYVGRIVKRYLPKTEQVADGNVVSKNTFMINTDTSYVNVPESEWVECGLRAFDGIYMPPSTAEGIKKIQAMPLFANGNKPKVLNMTELTPLVHELGYQWDRKQPLWYHRGVSIFDDGVAEFCDKIQRKQYDLVLFEHIPHLNNFYPVEVRDNLKKHYKQIDEFHAPRRPTNANIEVYVPE